MVDLSGIRRVVVLASAIVAVSGCAVTVPSGSSGARADPEGKLTRFISELSVDIDMDYTPLADSADVARRSSLTVVGRITGATEGLTIKGPSDSAGVWARMVNLDVSVDRVLGGRPGGDSIHVQVFASPSAPLSSIAANLPDSPVLLVLDDITHWTPFPGATIVYPAGLEGESLYTPYIDGVVFDDATGIRRLYLADEEAAADWTRGKSFDTLAASVEAAQVSP